MLLADPLWEATVILISGASSLVLLLSMSAQELKYMHLEAARELVEVKVGASQNCTVWNACCLESGKRWMKSSVPSLRRFP